jgi:NADH-quinone oxidoreductase subunit K
VSVAAAVNALDAGSALALGAAAVGDAQEGVPLALYLAVSGGLFLLGLLGVLTRRNPLLLFLAVELLLNSANLALVGFSRYWNVTDGHVFALVVMVVAAAEVVIGLGLVVAVFRQRLALDVDQMSSMKG